MPPVSPFFNRSPRDQSPLLPRYSRHIDFSLQDLSPRPRSSETSQSQSSQSRSQGGVSPSPPPSFYRARNAFNAGITQTSSDTDKQISPTPSPSRVRPRKIQFAGPPPPIASSVVLSPGASQGKQSHNGSMGGSVLGVASPKLGKRSKTMVSGRQRGPSRKQNEAWINLERMEKAIQEELQTLLDAQSSGLVRGSRSDEPAFSDTGSSSTRSRSAHASSVKTGKSIGVVPVRQPKQRVVSLTGARRGLLRDMQDLADIKANEIAILNDEIKVREEAVRQVNVWEGRIEGAKRTLNGYSESSGEDGRSTRHLRDPDARELAALQAEEKVIEEDIREMEDHLLQMRARKANLGERIKERVNKREAKLSSYRGALREIETEVSHFLKWPPIGPTYFLGVNDGEGGEGEDNTHFTEFPPHRRTLGMARECWSKEVDQMRSAQQQIDVERVALEEGTHVWEDSIAIVMGFEDDLRKQMISSSRTTQDLTAAAVAPIPIHTQLAKMREAITRLRANMAHAEDKGWNLLICAVGAELEAFKEGESILAQALQLVDDDNDDTVPSGHPSGTIDDDAARRQQQQTSGGFRAGIARETSSDLEGLSLELELPSALNSSKPAATPTETLAATREREIRKEDSYEDEDEGPTLAELMVERGHESDEID